MGIADVKNIILVLSGKGGVGKSSIAAHLALQLRDLNFKVGLLDVDLCGPSIPHLLNLEEKVVLQCSEGWMPVFVDNEQTLSVMSIAFLLNDSKNAVIWRGPKKNAIIKQFLTDVHWQSIDYLVVDMPPGTSDEHITIVENIKNASNVGAVLVTTPQMVAVNDVMREITFCKKASLNVIGIVENMSGFVCPNCKECSAVFSQGGGKALAKEYNLPFLGSLPIDPRFVESIVTRNHEATDESQTFHTFREITEKIIKNLKNLA